MLVLSRRSLESLIIRPRQSIPPPAANNESSNFCITIRVLSSGSAFVRLGIDAPEWCEVLRDELVIDSEQLSYLSHETTGCEDGDEV